GGVRARARDRALRPWRGPGRARRGGARDPALPLGAPRPAPAEAPGLGAGGGERGRAGGARRPRPHRGRPPRPAPPARSPRPVPPRRPARAPPHLRRDLLSEDPPRLERAALPVGRAVAVHRGGEARALRPGGGPEAARRSPRRPGRDRAVTPA